MRKRVNDTHPLGRESLLNKCEASGFSESSRKTRRSSQWRNAEKLLKVTKELGLRAKTVVLRLDDDRSISIHLDDPKPEDGFDEYYQSKLREQK